MLHLQTLDGGVDFAKANVTDAGFLIYDNLSFSVNLIWVSPT
jgi:hypothetical protein